MKTVKLSVIFGRPHTNGGVERVIIPDGLTRSRMRRMALHGPSDAEMARIGIGFQLLSPAVGGGWNVWGGVSIVH